jgi:hypothetical protein
LTLSTLEHAEDKIFAISARARSPNNSRSLLIGFAPLRDDESKLLMGLESPAGPAFSICVDSTDKNLLDVSVTNPIAMVQRIDQYI